MTRLLIITALALVLQACGQQPLGKAGPDAAPAPSTPQVSGRASFDCKLARTQVERLICSDPNLGSLDQEMAQLYAERRRDQPGSGDDQLNFIASRNRCTDAACLYNMYNSRIDELSYR